MCVCVHIPFVRTICDSKDIPTVVTCMKMCELKFLVASSAGELKLWMVFLCMLLRRMGHVPVFSCSSVSR